MSLYHITTRHIFCCAFWDLIVAAMSAITQNSPPVHLYCEIRAFMSMSIGRLSLEHCPRNRQETLSSMLVECLRSNDSGRGRYWHTPNP